jgi:hypothetical protein
LTATSSNHAELITLYDAERECVWLRSMIQHIQEKSGLESVIENPTVIYEDNTACIAQIKEGYIKYDRTKHSKIKKYIYKTKTAKKKSRTCLPVQNSF